MSFRFRQGPNLNTAGLSQSKYAVYRRKIVADIESSLRHSPKDNVEKPINLTVALTSIWFNVGAILKCRSVSPQCRSGTEVFGTIHMSLIQVSSYPPYCRAIAVLVCLFACLPPSPTNGRCPNRLRNAILTNWESWTDGIPDIV
jgi:hypothetical protein